MTDLAFEPLNVIALRLRSRDISATEVTQHLLDRIEDSSDRLNAFVTVTADAALADAARADALFKNGGPLPALCGIPVSLKDVIQTKGVRTSCGSLILKDWVPQDDAAVVERLRAAGAVILGKVATTEFATVEHPEITAPSNPWDPSLWPGGSSNGSGVAVAAGLSYASIGTDNGGSVRVPASANGVTGLKPSYGRVSRYGVFPSAPTLDCIGPLTRSVADALLVFNTIAGQDNRDPTSFSAPLPEEILVPQDLTGLRIGIDWDWATGKAAPEVANAIAAVVGVLTNLGAVVHDITMPHIDDVLRIMAIEASLAHRTLRTPETDHLYGPVTRQLLDFGASASGTDYVDLLLKRLAFKAAMQSLFETIDIIVAPVSLSGPLTLDMYREISTHHPEQMMEMLSVRNAVFNQSGNPALALPCQPSPAGPIGFQIAAPIAREDIALRVGHAYQCATNWHRLHPAV